MPSGKDFREGLAAMLSIREPNRRVVSVLLAPLATHQAATDRLAYRFDVPNVRAYSKLFWNTL